MYKLGSNGGTIILDNTQLTIVSGAGQLEQAMNSAERAVNLKGSDLGGKVRAYGIDTGCNGIYPRPHRNTLLLIETSEGKYAWVPVGGELERAAKFALATNKLPRAYCPDCELPVMYMDADTGPLD